MIDQTPDNQKQLCFRCHQLKHPRRLSNVKLFYHPEGYLDFCYHNPPKDTPTHTVSLCQKCRRRFAVQNNKRLHNKRPKYRLSNNIRNGIYKSLRTGYGGLWEDRVGYTLSELKYHLQGQFQPGMTWQNFGQWHIDHVQPIATFHFTTYHDKDFKRCWALSNLRPLWERDNWTRKKS